MSVILPGSYDPVTLGHVEIIRKAAEKYGEAYAVVFINPDKKYRFSLEDRVRMLILATEDIPGVIVSYSLGRVVDYMREHGIERIVKGYRNDADLAYERAQAKYNLEHGGYETELLPASADKKEISSTRAREALDGDGDCSELLPSAVIRYIEALGRE